MRKGKGREGIWSPESRGAGSLPGLNTQAGRDLRSRLYGDHGTTGETRPGPAARLPHRPCHRARRPPRILLAPNVYPMYSLNGLGGPSRIQHCGAFLEAREHGFTQQIASVTVRWWRSPGCKSFPLSRGVAVRKAYSPVKVGKPMQSPCLILRSSAQLMGGQHRRLLTNGNEYSEPSPATCPRRIPSLSQTITNVSRRRPGFSIHPS